MINTTNTITQSTSISNVNIINQAFFWMCAGLGISALTSLFVASSPSITELIFGNPILFYGLMIGELGLVLFLTFRINKLSYAAALVGFFVYAVLSGVTLSTIFLAYTSTSIATCFFAAAALFAAMAIYGYITERDLTTIGNLAFMALIGVILASLINLFLRSNSLSYILSYLTIAIFIGLTAYDTQKLKQMHATSDNPNLGVLGALMLYLDFINIFLNLLHILGRRRS